MSTKSKTLGATKKPTIKTKALKTAISKSNSDKVKQPKRVGKGQRFRDKALQSNLDSLDLTNDIFKQLQSVNKKTDKKDDSEKKPKKSKAAIDKELMKQLDLSAINL